MKEGSGSGCHLTALVGRSGVPHPLAGEKKTWCQGPCPSLDIQTLSLPPSLCPAVPGLTSQPHIDERVINQHQFVKVELVGEPFPLGLVQNAFVVIIAVGVETPSESVTQDPSLHPIPCHTLSAAHKG